MKSDVITPEENIVEDFTGEEGGYGIHLPDDVEELSFEDNESSWSHKLRGMSEPFVFNEFNVGQYQYIPIKDPNGDPSGYFTVFYRDVDMKDKWIIGNTLLSPQYNIVLTEKIIEELAEEITMTEGNKYVYPFITCYTAKSEKRDIKYFQDDCDKKVFQFITGMEPDDMERLNASVEMYIINSYNGTRSVKIIYTVSFEDKTHPNVDTSYMDFFTLENYGVRFIHKGGSVTEASKTLETIEESLQSSISTLKNIKERVGGMKIDHFASEVSSRFKKPEQIVFQSYWESLPQEDKSLLSLSLIASKVLHGNYDVITHNKLSSFLGKHIRKVSEDKNQN